MEWVDIGINLTNKRYDKDRDHVIQNALSEGVNRLIVTGTNVHESESAFLLTQQYPGICFATAGCHPHDATSWNEQAAEKIAELADNSAVVAIGECGLDFDRNFSPQKIQIKAFESQLELAVKLKKPVFLHERAAFDTQYQILTDFMPQLTGAVGHCFTGTRQALEKYLELGLSIGITGWICDERRGLDLFNDVSLIPDQRLMLETDGPYLTPRNLSKKPKGGRNEPMYLPQIGQVVAHARNQSLEHVAKVSYRNSCDFFGLE